MVRFQCMTGPPLVSAQVEMCQVAAAGRMVSSGSGKNIGTGGSRLPGQRQESARCAISGQRDDLDNGSRVPGTARPWRWKEPLRGVFEVFALSMAIIICWTGGAGWVLAQNTNIPGHALHEQGLQGQICVGTLVNSQQRRALAAPLINRR